MIDTYDTEQWLLGCLLKNSILLAEVTLAPEDFSFPIHGKMFADMQKLFSEKTNFSLGDFPSWTSDVRLFEDGEYSIAGYARGVFMSTITATRGDVNHFTSSIREARTKDKIMEACERVLSSADKTAAELAAMMSSTMLDNLPNTVKTGADVHGAILDSFKQPMSFSPTMIGELDDALGGGLFAGKTYGFCGMEKAGKTTIAHTISYNIAKNGESHLYCALEMGSSEIEQRNIARDLKINSLAFVNRRAQIEDQVCRTRARENIYYLDCPGATVEEILAGVTEARIKYKIKGFIVDYWQLISGQNPRETEEKHLRHSAQQLANYARKHGLWCIILAQKNANGELFGGKGLKKACDMLFMIESVEGQDDMRWLKMTDSRYTHLSNVGSESSPSLVMSRHTGPYFEEVNPRKLI